MLTWCPPRGPHCDWGRLCTCQTGTQSRILRQWINVYKVFQKVFRNWTECRFFVQRMFIEKFWKHLQIATVDPPEWVPKLSATQPFHFWLLNQFHSGRSTAQNVYESKRLIDWRLRKCHWRFLPRHRSQIQLMTPNLCMVRSDGTWISTLLWEI